MIVPQYWAESRIQHRTKGRQVTVRRFGWSDASLADAQSMADARTREACDRLLSGEKLARSEPRIPYNGAQGVPIREEIVSRHGETVITRNSYGARCLNTPNVLFVDIDFESQTSLRFTALIFVVLLLVAGSLGWVLHSKTVGFALALVALTLAAPIASRLCRLAEWAGGGAERIAQKRIGRFSESHPHWNLRLYRTPAGMRVIATHQTFRPDEPDVAECFRLLDADPIYVTMCRNQQCFRARVSAKPWRIGISARMRPRPGVWPVAAERMPLREAWIAEYEAAAKSYAACSLLESLGSGVVHPHTRPVVELHDNLCSATIPLPIA